MLFAERWHTSPFEVLNQDVDDFILIANSLIEGNKTSNVVSKGAAKSVKKQERIRVNDKTATGGWF